MASRTPRTPPNRSRSRRVSVPSVESMKPGTGLTFQRVTRSLPKSTPGGESTPAQAREWLSMDEETALAIEEARGGDTSILLPYQPTPSINPPRPRTLAAGYDSKSKTIRVQFRNGQVYEYYDVPPNVWRNFKRVKSPGRMVNRVLNNFEYAELHI